MVLPASASRSVLTTGMPPADRRLEGERDARLLGRRASARPWRGEQRLVGGDDVLAGAERRLDGRLGAGPSSPPISSTTQSTSPDAGQRDRIVEPGVGGEIDAAVLRAVAG